MQKLNLDTELKNLGKYLLGRLADYSVYVNAGPGEDDDQISLIAAGFEIEQSGWFSLVFNTRPGAKNNGKWTLWVEDNQLECSAWVINTPVVSIKTIDAPIRLRSAGRLAAHSKRCLR